MKKILVTSKDFEGEVILVYGVAGVGAEAWPPLLMMDFKFATLKDNQKTYIKAHAPVRYEGNFAAAWGTDKLRFLEADVELDFESDFWDPYDKKENRIRAEKEWKKLSKADKIKAVVGLTAYLWYLGQHQWRTKMAGDRYLRDKAWLTDWYNLA